ncbi:MAG: molybdopterin cofactor-binding domain-containing protein [Cytophagales bacterium]|nr:molybdopterin cofactor-binding domain-containing protein [Cytophagales bacterium]
MKKEGSNKGLSRRKFLILGGFGVGTTVIGVYACAPLRRSAAKVISETELLKIKDFDPLVWFEISEDNNIIFYCPKVEMGQGVYTGFSLLVAEELDLRLDQIIAVPASSHKGAEDGASTGGSFSTSTLFEPIREVAATMREMLLSAAEPILGVEKSQLMVEEGLVIGKGKSITYAEIARQTSDWKVPKKSPELKPASSFKLIGTDVKRVDLKPKVMGEGIYSLDAEMDGMLYAVTLSSPYFNGTLKSVDVSEAENYPGVTQVINQDGLVAVVAKNRFTAEMGIRRIKAEWDVPRLWQQKEIEEHMTVGNGKAVNIQKEGSVKKVFKQNADEVITAEYRSPIGIHAQMEPNGGIAHVQGDKATIITGTQSIHQVVNYIQEELDLEAENIEVTNTYMGGGFGRRIYRPKVADAVKISKIVGKPVQVFTTREEEFQAGYYRPNNHHVMKAVVINGSIQAIEHHQASDAMYVNNAAPAMRSFLGGDLPSANHCATVFYPINHRSTNIYDIQLPFHTGPWRAIGAWLNCFPIESFMDELAHSSQKDPMAFRLDHLQGDNENVGRMRKVIQTLRERSKWDQKERAGIGKGFACIKDRKTYVATALEIELVEGQVKVLRVTSVVDAGIIVNPEGARTQVEGCIMMGISAALYEEMIVKDSQFVASNYHEYGLATLKDTPEMDIILLDSNYPPSGLGEPPISPIAPALANAIFDLTGNRLRNIPLRPEEENI